MKDTTEILAEAVEAAYRKHQLDDDSIGWSELGDILACALCEHYGDMVFSLWMEQFDSGERSIAIFNEKVEKPNKDLYNKILAFEEDISNRQEDLD